MKKTILTLSFISLLAPLSLYADDEDPFNKLNAAVNDSFIKVIAKNRVRNGTAQASSYKEIDNKEEFLDALEAGDFDNEPVDTNKITTQYVYTEIKNVRIDKNDLKELEGDTLDLGTHIDNGKITQVLNIKNSKIETDKEINLAVTLDDDTMSSVTTSTNIKESQLLGEINTPTDEFVEDSLIDTDDELLPLG